MAPGPRSGPDDASALAVRRPAVRLSRAGMPGSVIALTGLVLSIILFFVLDARRHRLAEPARTGAKSEFPAPPPLALPAAQTEPIAVQQSPTPPRIVVRSAPKVVFNPPPYIGPASQMTPPGEPGSPMAAAPRANDPALVLDTLTSETSVTTPASASGQGWVQGTAPVADDPPVRPTFVRNRRMVMAMGTMIPAVLETPIDTAKPGLARAVVSKDARGFDGTTVLIPKGSRLIGEYQSDVRSGQDRVLVTWTRLIRPDGATIRIASPGADAIGGAGLPGHVNSFFFQRFAGAVLQSALTVGVNLASRPGGGSVVVGLPTNSAGSLGQDLLPANDLKPKITIKEGATFDIFVAHDLDFVGAPYRKPGAPG